MIIEQTGAADPSTSSTTTEEEVETENEQPTTTKKPTKARGRKSATSSSTTPSPTTTSTKAETGKIRKIVQIVTPANPTYTKGRCLQDESIEFRESKPLLGMCVHLCCSVVLASHAVCIVGSIYDSVYTVFVLIS